MYETKNVFILKGLIIKKKTQKDWEKEATIFNFELSDERKMSVEKFIEFKKGFGGCYDYDISEYNHAYFFNEDVAMSAAKGNMGGLDDGGVYNYCSLIEVPCGVSYPETGEIISMHLYKFRYDTGEFEEVFIGDEYEAYKKYCYIFD